MWGTRTFPSEPSMASQHSAAISEQVWGLTSLPHRQETAQEGRRPVQAATCSLGGGRGDRGTGLRGGDWASLVLLRSFSLIKCQASNTTVFFKIWVVRPGIVSISFFLLFCTLKFSQNTEQEGQSLCDSGCHTLASILQAEKLDQTWLQTGMGLGVAGIGGGEVPSGLSLSG